jgi:hypothetical protein
VVGRHSSVAEHILNTHKALGSTASTPEGVHLIF